MSNVDCPFCKKSFKDDDNYLTHKGKCKLEFLNKDKNKELKSAFNAV